MGCGELCTLDLNMHLTTRPHAQVDDGHNFTAIWVFTPTDDGHIEFKVYKEFDIVPNNGPTNAEFMVEPPADGYGAVVGEPQTFTPVSDGDD